jgi:hypothetical protein
MLGILVLASAALIASGCGVLDTQQISAADAAATVAALQSEPASYVHPKLIGPDWKFERVNESNDCAPDAGRPLPDNCHGQWWRSFNVINQSRSGMRISETVEQRAPGADMGSILQDQLTLAEQYGTVNNVKSFAPLSLPGVAQGTQVVRGTTPDGKGEEIVLIKNKGDYIIEEYVWGFGPSDETQAYPTATRVFNMLLDRVPDKLGGPVPNPDYVGNKYWDVR